MNRIVELFQRKDKDILNIYFTAGYPQLQDTKDIILALDASGVDLVAIGTEIERTVVWRDSADVSPFAGKPVRLRFVLKDADLFSFRFHPAFILMLS